MLNFAGEGLWVRVCVMSKFKEKTKGRASNTLDKYWSDGGGVKRRKVEGRGSEKQNRGITKPNVKRAPVPRGLPPF